jgi:hypothetical protein
MFVSSFRAQILLHLSVPAAHCCVPYVPLSVLSSAGLSFWLLCSHLLLHSLRYPLHIWRFVLPHTPAPAGALLACACTAVAAVNTKQRWWWKCDQVTFLFVVPGTSLEACVPYVHMRFEFCT